MIKGYKQGANITLLDCKYNYGRKREDGKYDDDFITILYYDNDTKKKKREVIKKPTYIFYEADDDVVVDHNLLFIEESKVREVEVPYSNLLKKIAEDTGNLDAFYHNIKSGHRAENNNLHMIKTIFNSDMNIEDHYRFRFDLLYQNNPDIVLSKAYFDIEVDIKDMMGDFPELGECPINILSYLNADKKEIHIFALDSEEYEGIEDFKDKLRTGEIFKELNTFIRNHMGWDKDDGERYTFYHINEFEILFHYYDSSKEIDMIADFFKLLHYDRPDFLMAWNMPFDIPYVIERVKTLGYNPLEICCAQDIPMEERYCSYWIDTRNKNEPSKRGDTFEIAGYTIFVDQLVQFASRRRGQKAFDNMKLDNIGMIITGLGKLNMREYAKNFIEFPRKNYKMFTFYNIMDSIVPHCIETKTEDINFLFNKSLVNNTRYSKTHRQTVYLTNRGTKKFREEGFIIGNNANKNNPKPPKFPGALVGKPYNNSNYSKMTIDQIVLNILNNLDDYDFKSLYPSIMRMFNIAPNTQIGKIIINRAIHLGENPYMYKRYDRGGQFLEDYQCANYLLFGHRWFHLGNYLEVLSDIKKYFARYGSNGYMTFPDQNRLNVVWRGPDRPINVVSRIEMERKIPVVTMKTTYNNLTELKQKITTTAQMDVNDYDAIIKRRKDQEEEEKLQDEYWTGLSDE